MQPVLVTQDLATAMYREAMLSIQGKSAGIEASASAERTHASSSLSNPLRARTAIDSSGQVGSFSRISVICLTISAACWAASVQDWTMRNEKIDTYVYTIPYYFVLY